MHRRIKNIIFSTFGGSKSKPSDEDHNRSRQCSRHTAPPKHIDPAVICRATGGLSSFLPFGITGAIRGTLGAALTVLPPTPRSISAPFLPQPPCCTSGALILLPDLTRFCGLFLQTLACLVNPTLNGSSSTYFGWYETQGWLQGKHGGKVVAAITSEYMGQASSSSSFSGEVRILVDTGGMGVSGEVGFEYTTVHSVLRKGSTQSRKTQDEREREGKGR